MNQTTEITESIQQAVARTIAVSPAGEGLALIGGFRYRLLDGSARFSADLDYHWAGSLDKKRDELVSLFNRRLLPEIKRTHGLDGSVSGESGPEDSVFVKTAELAFYRVGSALPRIEIPVDITVIECIDPPVAKTRSGIVYLTASDADMVESKVISIVMRTYMAARDLLDLFLFQNAFARDSAARIATKLGRHTIGRDAAAQTFGNLERNRVAHIKSLRMLLDTQVDESVCANINAAGGAGMVFESAVAIVRKYLDVRKDTPG
jgi:hypothetical protein